MRSCQNAPWRPSPSWRRPWPSIPIESIRSCGWGISIDQSRISLKPIRLHQHAQRVDDRNIEVLLELGKDLEEAKRYEEALQTLQKILKIEPDNLTALIRKRNLNIRMERWSDALEIQHRLLKANLPAPEKQAEAALLVGCMYEVGRQLLERGHPDKARRYFRGAIKKDRSFLPAYIGMGEILIHEGKTKDAVEILKKVYSRTRSVIILHRLEELFLGSRRAQRNHPGLSGGLAARPAESGAPVLSGQALLSAGNGG